MASGLIGTWNLESAENINDYFRALGNLDFIKELKIVTLV